MRFPGHSISITSMGALNLKDLAVASGTTFFFKQWGTWGVDGVRRSKKANGHLLGGVEYHNYPTPRVNY